MVICFSRCFSDSFLEYIIFKGEKMNVLEICKQFSIEGDIISVEPYGEGHINSTFLVETNVKKYILQKVNGAVFKNPVHVIENIDLVTAFLSKKIAAEGGDPERETLTLIPAKNGEKHIIDDGELYRVYIFIDKTKCYQLIENSDVLYKAAKAFAKFMKNVEAFDASKLHETIANFHNTADRYNNFIKAVEADKVGRLASVLPEVEFVKARKADTELVVNKLQSGDIPLRVTHNDTKVNNILMDAESGEGLCVIDLDTVMPGSLLYDFGDSLRFGASSAAEDETDLDKVYFRLEMFEAFAKGFLEEMSECITKSEVELLAFSVKLLTLECGMRFLTDYLDGDNYFKIHYPNHNLDRARNQFKLVSDMEMKMEQANDIVRKYYPF